MRTGEMDGPNEPSSQGVSSRVPVDHCWCQWPRHRCSIITPQWFCCCAENQDQSWRTAAVTQDGRRRLIKSDKTFCVQSVFSPHINNWVHCLGSALRQLYHWLSGARAAHSSSLKTPAQDFTDPYCMCPLHLVQCSRSCTSQLERAASRQFY